MSAAYEIGREEGAEAPASPHVFSRVVGVPAGAPWEQTRAAQLEARHGSPLPASELSWRIRRLDGWAPGRAARFAIFYVRTRELSGAFEATVEIEGSPLRVSFGSAVEQLRKARRLGILACLSGACAAVVGYGVVASWQARERSEAQLEALERTADLQAARAAALEKGHAASRELQGLLGRSAPIATVVQDFAWAATAKTPQARIDALHWDHGLLAIEARGDASPVEGGDRRVQRAQRPVRPGVWLWGAPSPSSSGAAQ